MIDPLLFMGTSNDDWSLDINITNGDLEMVPIPRENTTNQQRRAILAYQAVNSIPGDWNRGVHWGKILTSSNVSMADAMMDVQVALDADEGNSAQQSYTVPIIQRKEAGVSLQLLTVSTDDLSGISLGG